jgi:cardiolipin synthase
VVLLLQGKIEYRLAHYASRALFGTFLDAGVEIYEYHQSILHAKVAVIDDHWATVGSSNLDPFSLLLALEANIVVADQDFATALKDSLEQAIKTGARRVLEDTWRLQPFMLRLVCWLSFGLIRLMVGIAGESPKRHK